MGTLTPTKNPILQDSGDLTQSIVCCKLHAEQVGDEPKELIITGNCTVDYVFRPQTKHFNNETFGSYKAFSQYG